VGTLTYPWHLARRFAGSLSPYPPTPSDEAWAIEHLGPGERQIWARLANADRRHAVVVARDVVARLGPVATRPVVAAALLHDSGKVQTGYGTFARVGITLWAAVRGRARLAAGDTRVARYLRHDELGADALAAAGADPLTVSWAREHHRPPARWTIDPAVAAALKAADDD
jgi:hypothetical protein